MANMGQNKEVIKHGDRVAQLILAPVIQARFTLTDQLTDTARGQGGFGSTDVSSEGTHGYDNSL